MKPNLAEIVHFLDTELRTAEIQDYPNALNGLQMENDGTVSKIALAVDASEKAILEAIDLGADLLIVHHGLFWGGLQPFTGTMRRKLLPAIKANLAIYSSHLPLDIHPLYGNNSRLAFLCGMKETGEGFPCMGNLLGLQANYKGSCGELIEQLRHTTGGEVNAWLQTPSQDNPGKIMICSGGGGDEIGKVAAMGIDTYITGEGGHWTIPIAAELGINLIHAGHYETETFGVKSLGEVLTSKYGIPSSFIDLPLKAYSCEE